MEVSVEVLAEPSIKDIHELSNVLTDCVEGGATVGFMWPFTTERAEKFWHDATNAAAQGRRVIFVARNQQNTIMGTVSLIFAQADNQPHRADIGKMLVHRQARQQGLGAALMQAAEQKALELGKTLLVLDTASAEAKRLYTGQGWQAVGNIPNYALWPNGDYCETTYFFKKLI